MKLFSLFVGALLATGVQATEVTDGWTFHRVDGSPACAGMGPTSGDARLEILAIGPQLWLGVESSAFHPKSHHTIEFRADARASVVVDALADENAYRTIVNKDLRDELLTARRLAAMTPEGTASFAVHDLGAVMDAVLRCAGDPTWDEMQGQKSTDIAGAPGWTLDDHVPGSTKCTARKSGDDIDTILALNNAGGLIVIAARPNWVMPAGDATVDLQIDDLPVESIKASHINNLVLVLVTDEQRKARLRGATSLRWALGTARYHADVSGLGTALDSVVACTKSNAAPSR